jgi:hypothetical protein
MAAQGVELMSSSPLGPVEKVFNAVPSAPEQASEEVTEFRYAERHLPVWSFFLLALAI